MSFSSGVYTPPGSDFPAVASTLIESAKFNNIINDIATALTLCVLKDGTQTFTAHLPLGGFKITGLGNPTASTDAVNLRSVQNQTGAYSATVGGTVDAITLTPSPAATAYAAGQRFSFIASGANTGATTVNVSALGAKSITKRGTTALAAGDIPANALVTIQYDGTRFQLLSPSTGAQASVAETISGAWTFTDIPTISNATPRINFIESDQSTDEQRWRVVVSGKTLSIETLSGDGLTTRNILTATRGTGEAVTAITLGNTTDNPTVTMSVDGTQRNVGFRELPQNNQNGNYTCVLSDNGKHIYKDSGGSGETYTIPANSSVAYPLGATLTFINRGGGTLTIAITSDTLERAGDGATGSRTLADKGRATAIKVATTVWQIDGTGLT